jgi:hypothetical protein
LGFFFFFLVFFFWFFFYPPLGLGCLLECSGSMFLRKKKLRGDADSVAD